MFFKCKLYIDGPLLSWLWSVQIFSFLGGVLKSMFYQYCSFYLLWMYIWETYIISTLCDLTMWCHLSGCYGNRVLVKDLHYKNPCWCWPFVRKRSCWLPPERFWEALCCWVLACAICYLFAFIRCLFITTFRFVCISYYSTSLLFLYPPHFVSQCT